MEGTLLLLLAGLLVGGALMARADGPAAPPKAPRFPPLTLEQLNSSQRPLAERVLEVSSVGLGGPYNPLLRSPVLGQRMFELLAYLRWGSSLPPRLIELAILVTGRTWRSQVEWYAHVPLALQAGLSPEVIADLKARRRPAGLKPDEEVVHDFLAELLERHQVSDATFGRARQVLGEQQVVDLTAVAGTYLAVAMLLAVAEEGVPAGKEPPFGADDP